MRQYSYVLVLLIISQFAVAGGHITVPSECMADTNYRWCSFSISASGTSGFRIEAMFPGSSSWQTIQRSYGPETYTRTAYLYRKLEGTEYQIRMVDINAPGTSDPNYIWDGPYTTTFTYETPRVANLDDYRKTCEVWDGKESCQVGFNLVDQNYKNYRACLYTLSASSNLQWVLESCGSTEQDLTVTYKKDEMKFIRLVDRKDLWSDWLSQTYFGRAQYIEGTGSIQAESNSASCDQNGNCALDLDFSLEHTELACLFHQDVNETWVAWVCGKNLSNIEYNFHDTKGMHLKLISGAVYDESKLLDEFQIQGDQVTRSQNILWNW